MIQASQLLVLLVVYRTWRTKKYLVMANYTGQPLNVNRKNKQYHKYFSNKFLRLRRTLIPYFNIDCSISNKSN